ncbi:MAG: DsbA family protein, partial [Candidatus Promineifilaceae bacterium]
TKKTQTSKQTNWLVIGGVVIAGVIGLFALLYLGLREPEQLTLADYCTGAQDNCVTYGDANAPATLVEVSDFGCPHCRAFHQEKAETIMQQYVEPGQVRWVFVPYALRPETLPAANAALCANEQDRYFEFTSALFGQADAERSITRDGFVEAGQEVGLEGDQFLQCLQDGRYNWIVEANQQAARSAGVTATPTFFVNDVAIRGNMPLEEFERRFAQAIGG